MNDLSGPPDNPPDTVGMPRMISASVLLTVTSSDFVNLVKNSCGEAIPGLVSSLGSNATECRSDGKEFVIRWRMVPVLNALNGVIDETPSGPMLSYKLVPGKTMRLIFIGFGLLLSLPMFFLALCFSPSNVLPENLTGYRISACLLACMPIVFSAVFAHAIQMMSAAVFDRYLVRVVERALAMQKSKGK